MKDDQVDHHKRTKILATLGPASSDKKTIHAMIEAGLNAVRLNFSHGSHESHAQTIKIVRELSRELNYPLAVVGDLRGPHIRVGDIEGGSVALSAGQSFTLTPASCLGNAERVNISYPRLARDLKQGDRLLLDDGTIALRVRKLGANDEITCEVLEAGTLSSRRGINIPNVRLSLPPLTQKDLDDIDFAINQTVDFLALSFVQSAQDVRTLKTLLAAKNSDIPVIAKIEMSGGLEDIEAIVEIADGVMVARGDMALEMSFKEVPIAQKRIIAICRQKAKPVITATQMLESMIEARQPTRAEATDVANAVFDGTDTLMLSGETAIGENPVNVIATMSRIAQRAEEAWLAGEVSRPPELNLEHSVAATISYASATAAHHLETAAIVSYTRSGGTARRICRFRPEAPIMVLTPNEQTFHRLSLSWGITPYLIEYLDNTDLMTEQAIDKAKAYGFAQTGDYIIITAGNPTGPPGNTSLLSIQRVP